MKELKLSSGRYPQMFTQVDDEDYKFLNQWKWHAGKKNQKGDFFFVKRNATVNGKIGCVIMARLIMGLTDKSQFIDHKDGDSLNNQRSNLRIATRRQNCVNRRPSGRSKYLGVSFCHKKWEAAIQSITRSKIYLGRFEKEEDAAIAYNKAAIEIHGEFARLNIIPNL